MSKYKQVEKIALDMVRRDGLINLSCKELSKQTDIGIGSFTHVMRCTFSEFVNRLKQQNTTPVTHHKVIKTRVNPQLRKENILEAALKVAATKKTHKLQRSEIALEAGVSVSLISKYFGTMKNLQRSIVRAAITREIIPILTIAVRDKDKLVKNISLKLRTKVINGG